MPDVQKQFVIIGMGRFGKALAETLYSANHNVLAIDNNSSVIQKLEGDKTVTFSAICDAKDKNALEKLGIGPDYDCGIVCIGSDVLSSILAVLILKEMGVRRVIAKAIDRMQVQVLRKVGVDQVVFPEIETGRRLGHNLINTHILEELEISSNYSVIELSTPASFCGRKLSDLDLRNRFQANVLCIKRDGKIIPDLRADTELTEEDILVVFMPKDMARELIAQ